MTVRNNLALTRSEYEKILRACDSQTDRCLIMVGVELGLRRADIVKIRIADIKFTEHRLLYCEQKKGNRIRNIPISPQLEQELKIMLQTLSKNQRLLFDFSDKTAYNKFQRLCEKIGIKPRGFHALRATCVKLHQQQGWSVELVAKLIGDNITTVQQYYSTPSDVELVEIMRKS